MVSPRRMLILAEGRFSPLRSKTANGAIAFMQERVVGVIDSTCAGSTAGHVLGYGGAIPVVASIRDGLALRPDSLLIGIAPSGGRLPDDWRVFIRDALDGGLHVVSGLHTLLADDPEFAGMAAERGVEIWDLRRVPEANRRVSRGTWRTRRGRTILAVGTDCKIGKMTTILRVHEEFLRRGLRSDFIGTGQTGILIRGRGVSVDAVIGDYIAGSVEEEIDRSDAEGCEYIFVEGQGALTHQGYSSVTLGLMHGTMPDAMILVHQPTRREDDYGFPLPDLRTLIAHHEDVIGFFRPTKVVGIGLNSVGLTDEESRSAARRIEEETGLPAVDAFRFGGGPLAEALLDYLRSSPRLPRAGSIRYPGMP
jgi:uncharacterized NAD-dependent epimerase/dehydratase family protein